MLSRRPSAAPARRHRIGALLTAAALVVGGGAAVALATAPAGAAAPTAASDGWSRVSGTLPATRNGHPVKRGAIAPRAFALDAGTLTGALSGAPAEGTPAARRTLPVVSIPGADGALHRFRYVDSPVMQAGLARTVAFTSYAATSVDDPATTARFDWSSQLGFHATVRSPQGSWNVDPAYRNDTSTYLAYRGVLAASAPEQAMNDEVRATAASARAAAAPVAGGVVTQRVYRFALANDPGFATQVGAADVDTVKAALVNRVDEVYNDDLAIKLVLVAKNNLLDLNTQAKYTGANGPCGTTACFTPTGTDDLSACTVEKINQATPAITAIIGRDNYDVGHILDAGENGGIAYVGQVGQDQYKGSGCSGAPGTGNGDLLAVEFFAHELGHQFGATHTFSSASCGGYDTSSSVEPGSGATIMSYSGTCAPADNIQDPADPYFAHVSIQQIQAYVTSTVDPSENGGRPVENGGTPVTTTDHSPVVTVPATAVIPVRTPFTLSGTVTDADSGQTPVNEWEQNDVGKIRPLQSNAKPDGPLFRIFSQAAVSPDYDSTYRAAGENEATAAGRTRTFPDQAQIAAGNTNAATGSCPTANPTNQAEIECFAEFLPTSARTLHFDLTARDGYAAGGGVTTAQTAVTVSGSTPFAETNAVGSVAAGSRYAVTWNVAGTTAAPFDVADVKISYSTDGGLTFPTVLAPSVANTGVANVTVPAGLTTTGRIKVEAVGQPFFDISHANLTVTAAQPNATAFAIGGATAGTYGAHSAVLGRLTSAAGAQLAGETVSLLRRPDSHSPFARLKTVTTDSTGLATVLVPLTANADYEWTYAGTTTHDPSTSPVRTVIVSQALAVHVTASKVQAGALIKIYGTAGPTGNGQLVYLQKQSGSTWKNVTSAQIRLQALPNGTRTTGYLIGLRPAKGSEVYRTYKQGVTGLAYGTSSRFSLAGT